MLAEGGYKLTNDPVDRGGQTYAGISRRWHPKWPGWAIIDAGGRPPTPTVRAFYQEKFWDSLRLSEVNSQKVANCIYGSGVNSDPRVAAKLAQLVVGAAPDGVLGPVTLGLINETAPEVFIAQFTIAKIARYRDIVTKDRSQMKYFLGWVNRALKEAEWA